HVSHINLFYLNIANTNFKKVAKIIENIAKNIKPFDVTLEKILYFRRQRTFITLEPKFINIEIKQLYDTILAHCLDSANTDSSCDPHLIIGYSNDNKIVCEWKPITFRVNNLFLTCFTEKVDLIEISLADVGMDDSDSDDEYKKIEKNDEQEKDKKCIIS
ncbi:MAG: hypothetical protein Edafosvirus66_1, partial [Edafosvirus sp.]